MNKEEDDIEILASVTIMLGVDGSVIIDAEGSTISQNDIKNLGRFLFNITTGAYSANIIEILQKHMDSIGQQKQADEVLGVWFDLLNEKSPEAKRVKPLVRPTEFFRGANVR